MNPLSQDARETIFTKARSYTAWMNQPVPDSLLHEVYELMKFGPTSANCGPVRIVFVKSKEAKEKLLPCVAPPNMEKAKNAPVTAIVAMDMAFYEKLPKLYPQVDAKAWFVGNAPFIESTAFRNSSLQGGYFILAARSVGLDCGPMSGFDNAKMDAAFFAGSTWKSNFICNLGYGDVSKLHPRNPRLDFDEACKIL